MPDRATLPRHASCLSPVGREACGVTVKAPQVEAGGGGGGGPGGGAAPRTPQLFFCVPPGGWCLSTGQAPARRHCLLGSGALLQ